ncbi:hypothetical protein ACW0US_07090 [Xanthomonas euvesicatoria]
MTDQVEKPQPVDNSHLDAGIAARNVKEESEKVAAQDAADQNDGAEHEEQNDTEGSAASEADDAAAQRSKNKGVGKRIDELTREKYEALRRAEAAERRAQELEQQRQPQAASKDPAQSDSRPTLEQFNYDQDAYLEALTDWRVNQKLSERDSQQQAQQKQRQEQERQREFQARLASFEAENPGKWGAAAKAPINFTEPMLEVIASSEVGPHIAVYLSENLDRADEISRMTPYAQAAALGRIEAAMSAPVTAPVRQPTPKTVTKAPPPVTTLSGSPAVVKSLDDMSMAEYDAQRRKERKARGL